MTWKWLKNDWLRKMFSRFIHVVACMSTSIFYMAQCYPIVWIFQILFTYLSINGNLDCFHFWILWIMLIQIFMYTFMYEHVFNSLGCTFKSGVFVLHGNFIFNYLRNSWTILHSNCFISPSHLQCVKDSVYSHSF